MTIGIFQNSVGATLQLRCVGSRSLRLPIGERELKRQRPINFFKSEIRGCTDVKIGVRIVTGCTEAECMGVGLLKQSSEILDQLSI